MYITITKFISAKRYNIMTKAKVFDKEEEGTIKRKILVQETYNLSPIVKYPKEICSLSLIKN